MSLQMGVPGLRSIVQPVTKVSTRCFSVSAVQAGRLDPELRKKGFRTLGRQDMTFDPTMSAAPNSLVALAKTLPEPLLKFLSRYPPAAIVPEGALKTGYQVDRPNPFHWYKHPVTGKWIDPVYSLRRQAELVKMARAHGVEELLPDGPKSTANTLGHRVEHGLRVRGTGVGQRVKGHAFERHLYTNIAKRREAMLGMPKLITAWKKTGKHFWKNFPK